MYEVARIFGNAYKTVRPFGIRWEEKTYTITQIGYRHKYREGQNTIYVFSASDGLNYFELLVQSSDVRWILGRVQQPNNWVVPPK